MKSIPTELLTTLPSPALVILMEHVRGNIARVIEACGSPNRWRPHVKTTKMPEVWDELLTAGVRRFKCATPRELEYLGRVVRKRKIEGVSVLVAFPHVGPTLRLLSGVADSFPELRVGMLVEDPEGVQELPHSLDPWIDLNPGMDRTGIPLNDPDRILATTRAAGERLVGISVYDGHLHMSDQDQRQREVHRCYERTMELLKDLRPYAPNLTEVVTSGTSTFQAALSFEGFSQAGLQHTVSPGTVVFHDIRSEEENPGFQLSPAALVLARVISNPREKHFTCDAGSKSIAAEAGDPCAIVVGHSGYQAQSPSEEHLPFVVTEGATPTRGEPLLLIPRHVCPTVNLHEEAVLVEADGSTRRVPVAARAHAPWS
jgi:D-serine deaminase-like pyridoxal phosphate-dependent protein